VTIAELADRFLHEHVVRHCKPRTEEEYQRAVEAYIKPSLGCLRITDLTRADIAQFHHQHRDHPFQANRSLAVLSKMMNLAEAWGLRTDGSNPCRHVKKYREDKRERYLTKEELQRLGVALDDAKQKQTESPFVIAAIGLLVLTGARLAEILTLRWDYVDSENAVLRLPDSKTSAKLVYLNDVAVKLLRAMPTLCMPTAIKITAIYTFMGRAVTGRCCRPTFDRQRDFIAEWWSSAGWTHAHVEPRQGRQTVIAIWATINADRTVLPVLEEHFPLFAPVPCQAAGNNQDYCVYPCHAGML
jgi:integrase